MKSATKDRVAGTYHEAKGKAKEITGVAFGKPGVELEGRIEKNAGKAQSALGKAKKELKRGWEK